MTAGFRPLAETREDKTLLISGLIFVAIGTASYLITGSWAFIVTGLILIAFAAAGMGSRTTNPLNTE